MKILSFLRVINKYFQMLLSWLLHPVFIPTYGIFILMQIPYFQTFALRYRLVAVLGTFVLTGILPSLSVLIMMRRGHISDFFVFYKEERTVPYLYSAAAYIFWSLFLWRTLQMPIFFVAISVGATCAMMVIWIINWRWKISAHLAGMGGLVGGVFAACYQMAVNPLWLLVSMCVLACLLMISRLYLNAHTPTQVAAGFLLGLVSTILPGFIF